MTWLRGIGSELIGLFVDDGVFALVIVVWLLACGLGLSRLGLPALAPAMIMFVGLVLILAWSVLRRANERR